MSGISDLAKNFETHSKLKARHTEESVQQEFYRLERSISEALNSSAQNIRNVIQEETDRQKARLKACYTGLFLWGWGSAIVLSLILGGILLIQGTMISSRLEDISAYNQSLLDLKKQTGSGLNIDYNEKNRHYYVILPKHAKGVTLLSLKENQQQVVSYSTDK